MDAKELIVKYNAGQLAPEEYNLLEQYLERGEVALGELNDFQAFRAADSMTPQPSPEMSEKFYSMLASRKKAGMRKLNFLASWFSPATYRLAYSLGLLIVGLVAGWLLRSVGQSGDSEDLKNLSAQVSEMKEMMMLTLLEKESPSDRLRAVNLTGEMKDPSGTVTDALLKTLNNDQNVNVRLAALEALYPYVQDPKVRKGLVEAIAHQRSPIVQVALADLMAALQEKSSVDELRQILRDQSTPPEVKDRIEQNLEVLI